MLQNVLDKIAAPGPEFRGAPFWAWNSKLDEEELRRQIRFMKEMGLGGFFMHARVGLNTAYLSKEWFDCVRACIDEAKKNGMEPWLYDEDRFPSGAGGGFVTCDRALRQRSIEVQICSTPEDIAPLEGDDQLVAVFTGVLDGRNLLAPKREEGILQAWPEGRQQLIFYRRIDPDNTWYNGQGYLDTMNPAAVERFIEITHKAYAREVGSEFQKVVPGIFTDEPNYFSTSNREHQGAPWTDALPEKFSERYGYDLLDYLPDIFFFVDGKEFSRVRLDYRNLCSDLFAAAFAGRIGEWCEKNNMLMTGHVLWEDCVTLQTMSVGDAMRSYEYMQAPGIDMLTEHWQPFNTAKQCSSVAHQFGRERRLSETYGCTGWDFPFAGHKAVGDWQYALGINFRCQHLAWYSMEAEAKRDYPASISYQSPWFKMLPMVEDYFGRLGAALSEGEEQRKLLVIHPIESTFAWLPCKDFKYPIEDWAADESYYLVEVTNHIIEENIDFDFGSEALMAKWGKVEDGKLKVKLASYQSVLIPKLRTIRSTTLKLLSDFAACGGYVGYYGDVPEYVDGDNNLQKEAQKAYASFHQVKPEDFSSAFSPSARIVSMTDGAGQEVKPLMHILRAADDHMVLFVCNYGTEFLRSFWDYPRSVKRDLEFPYVKMAIEAKPGMKVYELNLVDGGYTAVPSEYIDGKYLFQTSFARLASRLFIITAECIPTAKNVEISKPALSQKALDGVWTATPDDFNVIVLDNLRYKVDGGELSKQTNFLTADDEIRSDFLGTEPRGWAMTQPWLSLERKPAKVVDLELQYEFNCSALPNQDCYFAVERPDLYDISVNGQALAQEDCGFWCDICIRRIRIPAEMLRIGRNTVILTGKYHDILPGLESAFILGQFGVAEDGLTIIAQPSALRAGDWCRQGFTNYSGNMTYRTTFLHQEKQGAIFTLDFPAWEGIALEVRLNNGKTRRLPWPPYTLDVTADLKDGINVLDVTVVGHRRNAFGPFYMNTQWPFWVGPIEYKTFEVDYKQLVPMGLIASPVITER